MNRKGVLVLASTYPRWARDSEPGFVHELSRRLATQFDVTVLCPHSAGAQRQEQLDGVDVRRYRYAPDRLETLVFGGGILHNLKRHPWKWLLVPFFLSAQAWGLWRLLRETRPAVIHAHWVIPQAWLAALVLRVLRQPTPVLVTCHGSDLFALQTGVLARLKRFALKHATHTTVVSRAMLEPARQLGVKHASVKPMGIDAVARFTPDAGHPRSPNELLFVGRLVEKKGLGVLIEALPAIRDAHPDMTLTVAGFGPEQEQHERRVKELGLQGAVRFLGAVPQSELPALYRRATLMVAPFVDATSGDREGFGLVVVEAMACGCPVLVSNVAAVADTVEHGVTGWLAQAGSATDLAAQANHLLANPAVRSSIGGRGRDHATQFDWTTVANGYAGLIRELAGEQSA